MRIVILVWGVLVVVSVGQIIYSSWKQKLVWKEAMFKLQPLAIGLLIFPFYWDIPEKVQWLFTGIGFVFLSVYAMVIAWPNPRVDDEPKRPSKNRLRGK